jgi:hypothetical protein
MNPFEYMQWGRDWVWGVPIIALNVVIHVFCLALFTAKLENVLHNYKSHRHFVPAFALIMGVAVIFVTGLHILEGAVWATAYRLVDALPDNKSAMLYSLGALTTYGHANVFLEPQWQMMGALEALNGMLLFGLTTAFLFAMIQRVWPAAKR